MSRESTSDKSLHKGKNGEIASRLSRAREPGRGAGEVIAHSSNYV